MKHTPRIPRRSSFLVLVAGRLLAWGAAEGQGASCASAGRRRASRPIGRCRSRADAYADRPGGREPGDGDRRWPWSRGRATRCSTRPSWSRATWWRSTRGSSSRSASGSRTRLPDFDAGKLVLSATHTHTAPVTQEGAYEIPKEGVDAAGRVRASSCSTGSPRRRRRPGSRASRAASAGAWGMPWWPRTAAPSTPTARRRCTAPPTRPDFRGIEGPEDQGVEVLFFWDRDGKLIATAVNVACPSQEVEGGSAVNADFWHEVREAAAGQARQATCWSWAGRGPPATSRPT